MILRIFRLVDSIICYLINDGLLWGNCFFRAITKNMYMFACIIELIKIN